MLSRFARFLLALLPVIVLAALAPADAAPAEAADDADKPQDLILVIDVSRSMIERHPSETEKFDPSDPEGMRWDGLQFAIDVARPEDRIALVLFGGTAAVVSQDIDSSGFVKLNYPYAKDKNGRTLLKETIKELQEKERRKEPIVKVRVKDHELEEVKDGTSVKYALQKIIKAELLKSVDSKKRQTWLFLFTDGKEEPPGEKSGKDYDYITDLQRAEKEAYTDMVNRWVKPFRDQNVPLFTFGLGPACDKRLLGELARLSRPTEGSERSAAAYFAETNVELFKQMREVCWELRKTWQVELARAPRVGQDEFKLPAIGPWKEVGLLLYGRSTDSKGMVRATAPRQKQVGKPLNAFEPLRSRSHCYYTLTPTDATKPLPLKESIQFVIDHPDDAPKSYETVAVAALRPGPQFRYRQPLGPPERYSPLDAIPFRVDFLPDDNGAFQANHFEVKARLTPVDRSIHLPNEGIVKLEPAAPEVADDGKRIVPFRGTLILDDNLDTKGNQLLPGHYHVDVTFRGLKGPLEGATRKLWSKEIEVKDYPDLTIDREKIELTPAAPKAALKVTLPVQGREGNIVANVNGAIVPPQSSDKRSLRTEHFRLSAGRVSLKGGEGTFTIEVPDAVWSGIALGKHTGTKLQVRPPWSGGKMVEVDVDVRKEPYELSVNDVQFDLSGKQSTEDLKVRLKTERDTEEKIWLTTLKDRKAPEKENEIELKQTFPQPRDPEKPPTIKLGASGLGTLVLVGRDTKEGAGKVKLALTRPPDLSAGIYQVPLYVRGESVLERAVTLTVNIDQPQAYLLTEGEKSKLPSSGLSLAALANSSPQRTLVFYKSLGEKNQITALADKLRGQDVLKPLRVRRVDDALPLDVRPQSDRVDLEFAVPPTVREGKYHEVLAFNLRESGVVLVPVDVEVSHGVVPNHQGPLQLRQEKPCDTDFLGKIDLKTSMETQSVRWWWECKLAPNPKGPIKPLDPKFVEIRFKGNPVESNSNEGVADPVSRDKPCPLTIVAHCGGLSPGMYHNRVVFHSYLDRQDRNKGRESELYLNVVVPGRAIKAEVATGMPQVGKEAKIRVVVSCYECPPGKGELRPKAGGDPIALTLVEAPSKEQAAHPPANYVYEAQVVPQRAGNNRYEVRWPSLCPPAQDDKWIHSDVDVAAKGAIELLDLSAGGELTSEDAPKRSSLDHLMVHPDEEFAVRIALDKAAPPLNGGPLLVEVSHPGVANSGPTQIALSDNGDRSNADTTPGDGIYSGKLKLSAPGKYVLKLRSEVAGLKLDDATVEVGFDYQQSNPSTSMYYGGGWVLSWWPGVEPIDIDDVIKAKNRDARICKWRATLCYPKTLDVSGDVLNRDFREKDMLAAGFDGNIHLLGQLRGKPSTGRFSTEADGSLSGELRDGDELTLGLHTTFSREVSDSIYHDKTHPTLDQANGLVLKLDLEWLDEQGKVAAKRTFYAPVRVRPRSLEWASWALSYVVLPIVVILILIGVALWVKRRQPAGFLAMFANLFARELETSSESAPKTPSTEPSEKPQRRPPGYESD